MSPLNEGEVFINVMEKDLITLIKKILSLNLKVGTQVGIISYNEIPLKKIILNGITTISSDFEQMGKIAAELSDWYDANYYKPISNSIVVDPKGPLKSYDPMDPYTS